MKNGLQGVSPWSRNTLVSLREGANAWRYCPGTTPHLFIVVSYEWRFRKPRLEFLEPAKQCGKRFDSPTPSKVWMLKPVVQIHECAQRPGDTNQHIQRFVPPSPGATQVKTPKTRKSDWLMVRSDWMPACRYVAARTVSSSRLRPNENCCSHVRNCHTAPASRNVARRRLPSTSARQHHVPRSCRAGARNDGGR